jgi:c-di-GMP-binding flagellar brake protein YcgR
MMRKKSEKRKSKRGPLQLPVIYTKKAVSKEGYITNLSAGGCRLYCYSPVPVKSGEPVEVSLNLKNSKGNISLKAQIIRVNPFIYNPDFNNQEEINYELGVKFLSVNESQQEALENYTRMVLRRMKQGML